MKYAALISLALGLCLAQEIATSPESKATFSSRVNLVVVPVVARDRKGKASGNLSKDDFQLFDKGKLQTITRFSVEKAGELTPSEIAIDAEAAAPAPNRTSAAIPTRFTAYVFDDLHIAIGDLQQIRVSTARHLRETLKPTDRVAIYTTSGIGALDFTDDHEAVIAALNGIVPRARNAGSLDCPPLSFYMADLIQNHNDPQAMEAAVSDTIQCANLINVAGPGGGQTALTTAQNMARSTATRVVSLGEADLQQTLSVLKDVVRRMATTPGQRGIVLISPGFLLTQNYRHDEMELIDRAIRAKVTLSSLDAKGLYVADANLDGSQGQHNSGSAITKNRYLREAAVAEDDVLAEVADGTGGTFFHNNNDWGEGLRRTGAAPEFIYLLGFSPQNLKYDGAFHSVKVTLKPKDLGMQARRGYYAPKHAVNQQEQAQQEIRESVFSREEVQEFPVEIQTQFFKPTNDSARVSLVSHIDLRTLHFQKEAGLNHNSLTIVSCVFDRNGNILGATERLVKMNLKDDTLAARLAAGVNVKSTFDVKPGTYVLRVVVRDSEGEMMSARNTIVDIP